ncbi:MAG TPA: hypothetical protein VH253_19110 [Phycisphaerae bacterium]|nr:hypothetical protein [Phycisphaerae bacterium]
MDTLKNIGFFVLCFALGAGLMWGIGQYWKRKAPQEGAVTGVGAAPAWRGFEAPAREVGGGEVKQWGALHATAVAVEYGPGGGDLKSAAAAAHGAGMKVVLMPGLSGAETEAAGGLAAGFSTKDPYPAPLEQVAREAEAAGVDGLCVSWLDGEPDEKWWRAAVAGVRKEYTGKVILAMTSEAAPGVTMWDAVDDLGIIGPVRLPRRLPGADLSYTVDDARVLWATKLDEWESIGTRYGKGVMLLNMRMMADAGSLLPAAGQAEGKRPESEAAVRETFYEGLLTETKGRKDTVGLFLPWRENGNALPAELLGRIEALWGSNEKVPGAVTEEAETEPDDVGG